jgi:hypothetical protein
MAGTGIVKWGNKDTPAIWLRWNRQMGFDEVSGEPNKYVKNVESRKCMLQFLHAAELAASVDALDLEAASLTLHVLGASSDYEGHAEWDGLLQRLPNIRELHVVMVGFVGKNHKTANWQEHLAFDKAYVEETGQISNSSFNGGKAKLKITRFQGTHCQYRTAQGDAYQPPEVAVLFNPGLDSYFDAWAPTITGLIDDSTPIIVTGYRSDSSNIYNPQILGVLGAKTVVPLTEGRFPYNFQKSANVMVTKGGTAVNDYSACKQKLKEIDPQQMGQGSFWDQELGLY